MRKIFFVGVEHLLSFFLSFLHKVRKEWVFTPRVRSAVIVIARVEV